MPEGVRKLKDWENHARKQTGLTRRAFLWTLVAGTVGGASGTWLLRVLKTRKMTAESFIASLSNYHADISGTVRSGFRELGISPGAG